jgi:2-alkyl-3-oxoalkanoate reductase
VVGQPLVAALISAGHHVTAITRSVGHGDVLADAGAEPVIGDVFDAERLNGIVVAARPEVVIQHLTSLPKNLNPRNMKAAYAQNDRVRAQGGSNLLAAAKAAGAHRYIAQNVCFFYAMVGPRVVDEDAPLALDASGPNGRSVRTTAEMERRVVGSTELDGLVLRFGFWYGPGTTFAADGYTADQVRRRRYPVVGNGEGLFPFVHIDDVVGATLAALGRGEAGIYNVADDQPAPMSEWLPEYAQALGAPPPRRIPRWLASLVVGQFVAAQATGMRGVSNAKAKDRLGWIPSHPTWRVGFHTALG